MKKLLVFFMVLFGISLGAMAEDYAFDGDFCAKTPNLKNTDKDMVYSVYFDTGKHEPLDKCKESFDIVRRELENLNSKDIAYFVMVASADRQGDEKRYDNDALSGRRYDYVKNYVLPSGIEVRKEGWVAGSASNQKFAPDYIDDWQYRSVYIYPVWARFECDAKLVSDINSNIAKLEKAKKDYPKQANEIDKILANYNSAHLLCDEAGKKLGATDSEALAKYLNGAFSLASNLKINIGITEITINSTDIDTHYYNLSRMRDSLKLSVWRDENGNFNTARLVSDSIAGVVLGTVGGIVTSKLVKKNQLKKGFEDLYCAIGGQTVAEYGDDFTVGMR